MKRVLPVLGVVLALVLVPAGSSNAAGPNVGAVHAKLVPMATGLEDPVAVAWRSGDTRMYVAEQSGRVRIVAKSGIVETALTLSVSHGGEQGLLGLAFSRDGKKLYVDYTDSAGDTRVAEYTMNGDKANTATRRQLLFQDQPHDNHNGGQVTMGSDGLLYVALGDGGGGGDPQGNGQKLSTWLGKILRIDPRPHGTSPYTVPASNPFVGKAGARQEIWMYGLRNPWRWSIDRLTGDTWIGDVGQDLYEEVDYAPAGMKGVNWAWNKREGFHPYNGGAKPAGARDPILNRGHSAGDCSVIGGYVYRGTEVKYLNGAYLFGDFCTGVVRAVVQSGGKITQSRQLLTVSSLVSFAEAPFGELYLVSHGGTIYKLRPQTS